MSSTDTRDRRATEAVACPECGAPPGELCRVARASLQAAPGRPLTHSARRAAFRDHRDRAADTAPCIIEATIQQGPLTERFMYDLDNRDECVQFAVRANHALRAGATVTTRRLPARFVADILTQED